MEQVKKLIPKRRFKEFQNAEAWEECKLGEIVDLCSGRDYKHLNNGNIPVYGTGGYMLSVNDALSYDKDAIGIGRKGTIDKPYILKSPFWTVDTLFYAIPRAEYNLDFLYGIFQNIDWKQKDESSGVPSLSKVAINNTNVLAPEINEQKRIGYFFKNLDNLIILHQRKLDKIKSMKKAYLYEMFPAVGESKPKRRFKGFTDDWEQRKLEKISEFITKGATPTTYGFKWMEDGIPFFRNDSIKDNMFVYGDYSYISEEANSALSRSEIRGNDILVAITGDIGKAGIVPESIEKANINQHMAKVRIKKCAYSYFVYQYLSTEIMQQNYRKIKTGISMPQLSLEQIRDIDIQLPYIEEQTKIGNFFRDIDNLITLHQQKLDKLKNLKKSYLSEMFI